MVMRMMMIYFNLKVLGATHWSISLWEMRSILFWTSTIGMSPHSSSTFIVMLIALDPNLIWFWIWWWWQWLWCSCTHPQKAVLRTNFPQFLKVCWYSLLSCSYQKGFTLTLLIFTFFLHFLMASREARSVVENAKTQAWKKAWSA